MTMPSVLRAVKPGGSSIRWRRPAAARNFSVSAQAASPVKVLFNLLKAICWSLNGAFTGAAADKLLSSI